PEGAKRTTMELGVHAPVLVFDDVDVDQVVELSVAAKFRNAGQVCVSPTRFYVHESIFERFVAGFAARANALRVSAGRACVEDAGSQGARIAAGGRRIARRGWFHEPTVLAEVPNSTRM